MDQHHLRTPSRFNKTVDFGNPTRFNKILHTRQGAACSGEKLLSGQQYMVWLRKESARAYLNY